MRTRIAPTPSGYLHVGNAYNFYLIQKYAKEKKGTILLRIDDFDFDRARDEYIEDIFKALEWLQITPDEDNHCFEVAIRFKVPKFGDYTFEKVGYLYKG